MCTSQSRVKELRCRTVYSMVLYGRFCNYTVHTFSDLCLHIQINASQVSVPKRVLRKCPNSNAVSLSYLMVRAPERLDLQQMPLREELDSLAEVCFNWRVKSHGAFFSRKRVTLGFYIVDIMVLHNGKSSEGLELKSLLFSQLSTRSYNFCSGFQRLYESHNNGAHKPTGSVLIQNPSRHPPFQIAARSC